MEHRLVADSEAAHRTERSKGEEEGAAELKNVLARERPLYSLLADTERGTNALTGTIVAEGSLRARERPQSTMEVFGMNPAGGNSGEGRSHRSF